ncbi:MAG TPA: mechanosensitive ion channel family protein [Gemmatimonadaceae bacterium]|nr:mechanosensitive ion channel family protein [Gemmatimonadaceae bacterium]
MTVNGLLDWTYFGNSVRAWLIAAGVLVVTTALLVLIKRLAAGRLSRVAERTDTHLDNLVVDLVARTRVFFLLTLGAAAALAALTVTPRAATVLWRLFVCVFVVQGALWANGVVHFWVARYTARRDASDAGSVMMLSAMGVVIRLVLWAVALLLVLDNFGVDVTALIAGLGVGGIAVALAVQNILGDALGALSIVLDKPFIVGDFIVVDDLSGTVEYVGLKTTRLRSISGEQLVFSNGDLLKSRIRNYKRMFERRVVFTFGVTYGTPRAKLAELPSIVRRLVEGQKDTRFDRAHFARYSESSLDFEVVYYVKVPDYGRYMDIQQAINLALLDECASRGIEFAYPTRTLYIAPPVAAEQVAAAAP